MKEKITFEGAVPVNDFELQELEKTTGFELSNQIKELFKLYAGARPSFDGNDCIIDIIHSDGWKDRNYLFRIKSPKAILENWDYRGYLEDFQKDFELNYSYVEANKLFPIIELPNSELYIAVGGQHDGKIYYVDNGDFGIILIADSLQQMMDKLYKELTRHNTLSLVLLQQLFNPKSNVLNFCFLFKGVSNHFSNCLVVVVEHGQVLIDRLMGFSASNAGTNFFLNG